MNKKKLFKEIDKITKSLKSLKNCPYSDNIILDLENKLEIFYVIINQWKKKVEQERETFDKMEELGIITGTTKCSHFIDDTSLNETIKECLFKGTIEIGKKIND